MNSSLRLVYLTARDEKEAIRIGRALVDERLAACVNILGPVTSVYRWEGQVQVEGETAFLAKTTAECAPALIDRVKALHSYDVPCIVTLPIEGGFPPFLAWAAAACGGGDLSEG